MSVRVACPACDTPIIYSGHPDGVAITCPKCGKVLKLRVKTKPQELSKTIKAGSPGPTIAKARGAGGAAKGESPKRTQVSRQTRKGPKVPVWLWLVAGGAAVTAAMVVCAAIGIWLWTHSAEPAPVAEVVPQQNPAAPPRDNPKSDVQNLEKPANKEQKKPRRPDGALTADVLAQGKSATVFLQVKQANGKVHTGSGFIALQRGIVLTNAHVVGMVGAKTSPPQEIKVVIDSGAPEERFRFAEVIGVDRVSDLAVVRISADAPFLNALPEPLTIVSGQDLQETQSVFVAGFPFGEQLGKAVTISNSSITSLRREPNGELAKIQVNGGMQQGNSGGPVVNALGQAACR